MRIVPWVVAAIACTLGSSAVAAPFAYVANRGADSVNVIDTATDTLVTSIPLPPGTRPQSATVSRDGTRIFVGSPFTLTIQVINAYTNTIAKTINVLGNVTDSALSPDGTQLWAAGGSSTVKTIDVASEVFTGLISAPGLINFPNFVTFSADGATAFVSDVDSVTALDVASRTPLAGTTGRFVQGIVAHPDGRLFAASGVGRPSFVNDAVYVIDQATMVDLHSLDLPPVPTYVALSPDATGLYVVHGDGGGVSLIETAGETVVTNQPTPGYDSRGVRVHPDGTRVYLSQTPTGTTTGGIVTVFDAVTLAVLTQIPVGDWPIGFGQFIGPVATCGDGQVTFPETCDDGNTAGGDCCAADCTFEPAASPCAADGDLCTSDQCDGAGACVHPPVTCDDGSLCTTDDCNPSTGCTTTPVTCIDGDACTEDGCAPATGCTFTPLPDGDGDGLCDDIDPCTGPAPVTSLRLRIARPGLPLGDERFNFSGRMTLPYPFSPAFDPAARGVRVILTGAGGPIFDTTIAGGAGWRTTRGRWTYSTVAPTPPGGFSRIAIWDQSYLTPGLVKFLVRGRNGAFLVGPSDLPLSVTLVLDPPTAATGQCALATGTCDTGRGHNVVCR